MELSLLSKDGSNKGKMKMPLVFSEKLRKDVIKRAVEVIEANNRQPYGAKADAGMRASAKLSRRRNDYRGSYGHGISRVPRKIMSRRGTRLNWVAAVAPGTVGGRRAHPPKASKRFDQKINAKENRLAIRSAIAATLNKELVLERGHKIPDNYPFIIDDSLELISKTKELMAALAKLGFTNELERTGVKKIRAGRAKLRGRKYSSKKGVLLVTAEKCDLQKACSNILGFETARVDLLNAKLLAPGGVPGRVVLFTKKAIEKMESEKLFTEERIKKEIKKVKVPDVAKKEEPKKVIKSAEKKPVAKEMPKQEIKKEEVKPTPKSE